MHAAHQHYQPVVLQRQLSTRPDLIALVGFGNRAIVLASPATAAAPAITRVITSAIAITSDGLGGGTNIAAGLRVAATLLRNAPKGFRKRIWLLSDGMPNDGADEIFSQLQQLRNSYVNVNTIAFGDEADVPLLKHISAATHNGRFFQVNDLAALTAAFVGSQPRQHSIATKPELTVYVIDKSGSMWDRMGTSKKIEVVQQALLNLVHYKKQLFS